jgi:hypothetical protein
VLLIQLISVMHLLLGILLLVNQGALHIASTRLLVELVPEYHVRAALYILAGLAPALWTRYKRCPYSWVALVPQMVLVGLSALSVGVAIGTSTYADGVLRDPKFIAADQLPYLLLPLSYMYGIAQAEKENGHKKVDGEVIK